MPTESAPLVTYLVKMLPASGSSGQAPTLTCGFHGGSCGAGSGDFLDWDNTSTSSVYFRGIFTRGGSPRETNRLIGKRVRISGGGDRCEEQRAYIVDTAALQIRGTMRYLHASMNSTADFSIATSGSGELNSRTLGSMIQDTGCGAWNGTHVHAGYTTTGSASRSKNTSRFPSGDYCTPGVNCNSYTNTSSSNWTHKFTWSGN
ncbi:MAG: hypothetical protein NUW02_00100 [Candidatus Campbellbacteria bacterium]|nr:hypothetical protein [Candidatus Campbellbacteria bacterium]